MAVIGTLIACSFSPNAWAADIRGRVIEVNISKAYGNFAFIKMDTQAAPPLACSTHAYWHYTLPLATDVDKRLFSMLVIAETAAKQVEIFGAGACSELGTIESASGVRLMP